MSINRIKNLTKTNLFPIVCVGASAGGLEALIALLKFLPQKINMAFVVIQHLEPQHKSALTEILSRETSLNISEAENNIKVEPAHIYVIKPNTRMTIAKGRLKITSRKKRIDGTYLPVDFFMNSLANDQKEKAIGIILSGTGSDGTLGAKTIKAKGGIVFAQDEKTARFFGMPGSVIASGSADLILAPSAMARKLISLKTHGKISFSKSVGKTLQEPNELNRILVLLRDRTGVDFIHYKQTTIGRRISRRMAFHHIVSHADYFKYLKKNPAEADILRKEILIPVTSFFRDPEMFVAVKEKVFPLLINKRSPQNPIRLWVPACSSGEEVYSFAIFLYEYLDARNIRPCIQVFGTDLSETVIEKARAGLYAPDISAQVSAERLRRFFVKTETGYKIAKHIRDLCIFAKQDIISNSPLSNMDLVSCRNLLIYLDTFLQNKALSMLHYALKPNGFLFLGSAESVTAVPDFFNVIDKKHKIYSKNVVPRAVISHIGGVAAELTTTKTKVLQVENKFSKRFQKVGVAQKAVSTPIRADKIIIGKGDKDVAKLKKEFERTEARLKAISEEKDTFNEELKAASEEVQSSNEELQSMNEELETSKEELQSTNEELLTLNEELQNKNAELTHLNSDLSNVFSSTNIPLIIVGNDLRIKRFTPTARKVMNLIPTDVDRPIGDIKLNVDIVNLEEILLGVIEDMTQKEFEVKDKEGRWYSVRIRPYRTIDNKIDGAVIALVDIDVIKRSREEVQASLNYAQAIVETMREPLVVLDSKARVMSANKSFCNMFKVTEAELKNKLLYELSGKKWNNRELRKLLEEILPKKNYFNNFEAFFDFPDIGPKTMVLNARQIKLHGKDSPLILLVIEDITKRKNVENILKRDKVALDKLIDKRSNELMRLKEKLVKSKHLSDIGTLAATVAHEIRNPLADIAISAHRIKKIVKDPAVGKILAGISARVFESDQIIKNILMYSKTILSHRGMVKINGILKAAIEEEIQKVSLKKIAIKMNIDGTKVCSIDGDAVRLKEVIHNILHNAIDAVSVATGIIEVESHANKAKVFISIKDNGVGISKKDLKSVMSPFFTTKTKGTGLGLAVCKQIVTLHGGSITIKSIKGKGTTVAIMLPIHGLKDAEKNSSSR